MVKNQKLSANILTPTTKAADHDVPVTPDEVSLAFNIFPLVILRAIVSCKLLLTLVDIGRG